MYVLQIEQFLGKLLGFTGAFTTIFLISNSVTDPVNAPKLVAIGVLGSAAIGVTIFTQLRKALLNHKVVIISVGVFFLFMIVSTISSKAPFSQLIYGNYGRNNGLLTYLFLSFILISGLTLNSRKSFQSIVNGLLVAGSVNIVYCLWVIVFGDFIGWNNPYGNILGTLGNPNFIGAFLGIIFSALVAIVISKSASKRVRIISTFALPICAYEILNSHAIQGRVVAAFGTTIVFFLYIRSRDNKIFIIGYLSSAVFAGIFALAGALQIGPLTHYIYKTSVSLRGQYWLAGWNTGLEHPITGVGMDAFGDWYRRMRDPQSLVMPGVNTVVNAAHNVPIDIFAFGGWPLFICYIFLLGLSGYSIFKIIRRVKVFDSTGAIMISAWAGYQLQSIISINQIGLAIWGWLLSGSVIAYERLTRNFSNQDVDIDKRGKKSNSISKSALPAHVPLLATIGGLVGLLVALPPLSADVKWRSSQLARTLPSLESALSDSYFNPPNSNKYLNTIQTLEESQLFDLSHKYAVEAVRWNQDAFELWKVLYLIKNSTPQEKDEALRNMKRLDPLNPDVTAIR